MKRLAQDLMAWKKTYNCFEYPHAKTLQIFLLLSLFFSNSVFASQRIAVLDFELNDMTELPNIPAELASSLDRTQWNRGYSEQ